MSNLRRKLAAGELVITGELPVINGDGLATLERHLEPIEPWLDAINATDNPSARAHAAPLAVAIGLRQAGVEPIMQLTCRDRNRLALEADLVGAAMLGIENICCLTGDDVTAGDEPQARRVFDLDGAAADLACPHDRPAGTTSPGARSTRRRGSSSARSRTRAPRPLSTAGAAPRRRPTPAPASCSCSSATAPSCSSASFAGAHERGVSARCALLPSICMVGSAGALRFIDQQRARASIPEEVIAGVERAADGEEACFELACEQAPHALSLPGVAGPPPHLVSQGRRHRAALPRLGIPPRAEREQHGHRSPVAV